MAKNEVSPEEVVEETVAPEEVAPVEEAPVEEVTAEVAPEVSPEEVVEDEEPPVAEENLFAGNTEEEIRAKIAFYEKELPTEGNLNELAGLKALIGE